MSKKKQKFLLGIGAPRSGTTWTYTNLRVASSVFMPPVKELRFFRNCRSEKEKKKVYDKFLSNNETEGPDAHFMKRWSAVKDCDHAAYASMFPLFDYVGEFSPIYSIMNPNEIEQLKNCLHNFDVKILYLLRNPLDRDISHIYFAMHRQKKVATTLADEQYMGFINNKTFIRRSNYRLNAANWRAKFGDDMNLMYYDHIKRDPRKFINKLCSKFDIKINPSLLTSAGRNGSGASYSYSHIKLPEAVVEHLRQRHLSRVSKWKFLPDRIKETWLEKIEKYGRDEDS